MSDQRPDDTPREAHSDDSWHPDASADGGSPTGDQRPVWAAHPTDEGAAGEWSATDAPMVAPAEELPAGAQPTEELPAASVTGAGLPWGETRELPAQPEAAPAWAAPSGAPVSGAPTPRSAPDSATASPWSPAASAPVDAQAAPRATQSAPAWSDTPGGADGAQDGPYVRGPEDPTNPWAAPQAPSSSATLSATGTKKKRGTPGWLALLVGMIITALVTMGGTYALLGSRTGASSTTVVSSSATPSTATTVSPVTSTGTSADWEKVASAVSPAVVTITVDSQSSESIGSGVIFDASGHVVTNYHVISEAASSSSTTSGSTSSSGATITVTLSDGAVYTGKVVGYDETTDLAVVQIENAPSNLTVATFGSSSKLTVGQQVMAIGAPLGLSNTVTTGVVSALNRPVEVSTTETQNNQQTNPNDPFGQLPGSGSSQTSASTSVVTNAIQVDASINPGNSGGPLFDETGAVIGINSSIASTSTTSGTAGSIGLGFAIPVDLVKSVVEQLISTGSVDHAVLGVTIEPGTATVDGTTESGAKIDSVTSGSGASEAGLKAGDVILSIDGNSVTSAKSLTGFVRTYKGGDRATIVYVRDGVKKQVSVTLRSTK